MLFLVKATVHRATACGPTASGCRPLSYTNVNRLFPAVLLFYQASLTESKLQKTGMFMTNTNTKVSWRIWTAPSMFVCSRVYEVESDTHTDTKLLISLWWTNSIFLSTTMAAEENTTFYAMSHGIYLGLIVNLHRNVTAVTSRIQHAH